MADIQRVWGASQIQAKKNGTSVNYTSAENQYIVKGCTDQEQAITSLLSAISEKYLSLPLEHVAVDERCGSDTWKLTAYYTKESNSDSGGDDQDAESSFSFDTSGGTKHLTHSLDTVKKSSGAPQTNQAIGFDGTNVQGVDVTMPVYNFSETHFFKKSKVSTSFKKKIMELTGKVNNSSFKGFSKGQVLFLGASGSRNGESSDDLWQITFKFAVSPNQSGIKVGNISVGSKQGWQYLWVRYGKDSDGKNITAKPIGAYVQQVYEYGNLKGLGIGG